MIAKSSLKSGRWHNSTNIYLDVSLPWTELCYQWSISITLECQKWQRWKRRGSLKMIDFAPLRGVQLLNVIGICGWYALFLNFSRMCRRQREKIIVKSIHAGIMNWWNMKIMLLSNRCLWKLSTNYWIKTSVDQTCIPRIILCKDVSTIK